MARFQSLPARTGDQPAERFFTILGDLQPNHSKN
jgi:hypothetical protein